MTKPKYAYQTQDEHCAKVYGRNLPVSTKTSIEMCNFLRGKTVERALTIVENVMVLKEAIPFTRFLDGVGHRRGRMASGRYPVKLATEMRKLLKSVKANAENKNFSDNLKIVHLCAHKAATPFHQGRQSRRAMKRTHIELIVKEDSFSKPKVAKPKPKVVETPKVEVKKTVAPKVEEQPQQKVEEKPVVKTAVPVGENK